jgi:pimeloyl-ACP methyl ester carboxylesterase
MKIRKPIIVFLLALFMVFSLNDYNVCAQMEESHPPMPEALEAMESDLRVDVSTVEVAEWEEGSNFYFAFKPKHGNPTIGFIFYPGGLVDPRAYAPPAHAIAAQGYVVVIVKMIRDLAVLSADRADRVISDFSEIKTWIIGGHSIGGSFACYYAHEHTEKLDGVVLWAAWPSEAFRLDGTDLKAISIYGTNDGHPEDIRAGEEHLPDGTPFVAIEGGNHTQCGYYWDGVNENFVQDGDNPADISREQQQRIMVQSTLDFLKQFKSNACPASFLLGADAKGIAALRNFRDTVMAQSAFGKKLIAFYYANGDRLMKFFDHNPSMHYAARKAMKLLVPAARLMTAWCNENETL